jgi:hypothetical protein
LDGDNGFETSKDLAVTEGSYVTPFEGKAKARDMENRRRRRGEDVFEEGANFFDLKE